MSTRGIVLAWSAPSTLAQDALTPALPGVELLKAGKTDEAASALDEALANAWLQSLLTFRRVLFVNGTAIRIGH